MLPITPPLVTSVHLLDLTQKALPYFLLWDPAQTIVGDATFESINDFGDAKLKITIAVGDPINPHYSRGSVTCYLSHPHPTEFEKFGVFVSSSNSRVTVSYEWNPESETALADLQAQINRALSTALKTLETALPAYDLAVSRVLDTLRACGGFGASDV